jgi:peptidase E
MPHIVGMGGGGFSMEPDNLLLDEFILSLVPGSHPKVLLLPTASADSAEIIDLFHEAIGRQLQARTAVLRLTKQHYPDMEGIIMDADIIYVTGGHTTFMLDTWKGLGIDKMLHAAWKSGVVMAGVSSGSACWFDEAVTDSKPEGLSPEPCLGLLRGSHCAHYENEGRRPSFHKLIGGGQVMNGYGVENCVGLHFEGTELKNTYASRKGYQAYRVEKAGGEVKETPLPCTFLGY